MDLIVLGAGPAYTDRAGAIGSSYLVRDGTTSVLLDLGQGAFPSLAGEIEPSTLAAVVVSHLHPDHFVDLVALRHYLRFEFDPPRRVVVHAPADLPRRLDSLFGETGFTTSALDVRPLGSEPVAGGALRIEPRRVTHTADSHAFRVSQDGAATGLVYSGDCGRADDLAPLIQPGDALLVEVSFGPGPAVPGAEHLDGPAVGALAARARAGRVLLTHLLMGRDRDETIASVARLYDGPVELVEPGYRTVV